MDEEEDFEVGYCKPPKKSQFQPGVSGNLGGRPKKLCPLTFEEQLRASERKSKAKQRNQQVTLIRLIQRELDQVSAALLLVDKGLQNAKQITSRLTGLTDSE
jgi:hypothetical protein